MRYGPECTKLAHRHALEIFTADSGIAGNSAVGISLAPFDCSVFERKELALGALNTVPYWCVLRLLQLVAISNPNFIPEII